MKKLSVSVGAVLLWLPISSLLFAASDVSVTTAATSGGSFSGGNPNVFAPTADAAVANQITIQVSLNEASEVTINTASGAMGNGDLTVSDSIAKTEGDSSTLTLNAVHDLIINGTLSASAGGMPLVLSAGHSISASASIASNGGDITVNSIQPFSLGSSLDAGVGRVFLQTGSIQSADYETITASGVIVSAPAAFRLYGGVTGDLTVAGTIAAGDGTGSLSVSGALTLESAATTNVKLGGTSQGAAYGSISAGGVVAVRGTLQVDFANGFEDAISPADSFTIVSGGSVTGIFDGQPNDSRITLRDGLGSIKINYTETAVTLSDWQPVITDLAWDPGSDDDGTEVFSNTNTRAGRHYFHIYAQETDIGAWRSRLTPSIGEADLYMSRGSFPTTVSHQYRSNRDGADGFVLRSDEFDAGEDWYILVNASAGAQWSLFSGRAYVQDLGALQWTDTNANSEYDISETALPSGSGAVNIKPEGMRFFQQTVPTGTPAWSLWLNGDPREIAIRKNFVPFHDSPGFYGRKQSGQMLVAPTYLGSGPGSYFLSVIGNPGDTVNLDSRIQEISDVGFNTSVNNVNVSGAPYRVYRVQFKI
jgi:hypothetical protein